MNWEKLLSLLKAEARQKDLIKLTAWAITSYRKFNKDKYWILYLDQNNSGCTDWGMRCWRAGKAPGGSDHC